MDKFNYPLIYLLKSQQVLKMIRYQQIASQTSVYSMASENLAWIKQTLNFFF